MRCLYSALLIPAFVLAAVGATNELRPQFAQLTNDLETLREFTSTKIESAQVPNLVARAEHLYHAGSPLEEKPETEAELFAALSSRCFALTLLGCFDETWTSRLNTAVESVTGCRFEQFYRRQFPQWRDSIALSKTIAQDAMAEALVIVLQSTNRVPRANWLAYSFAHGSNKNAAGKLAALMSREVGSRPAGHAKSLSQQEFWPGSLIPISFTNRSGGTVDLRTLTNKVVMLEIWSTECGPCVGGMPSIQAMYQKYHARGFEIVGINLDENQKELEKFLARTLVPWTQCSDGEGFASPMLFKLGTAAMPEFWLIDKKNVVREIVNRDYQLEDKVAQLLSE